MPPPTTARGPRPSALRADVLARRGVGAELPAILRGHHPRGRPRRGARGLRREPRRDPAVGARGARRRAAGRSSGRAARPGRLPRRASLRRPAPRYVLVEKILEHGETLPAWWETDGTTGYDALAEIDRVLVDPDGRARPGRAGRAAAGWSPCVGRPHPRHEAHDRRHDPVGRGPPARARAAAPDRPGARTPSPSSSPASRSTARTSPRARSISRPRRPRHPLIGRTWPRRSRNSCRCSPIRATRCRVGSSRRPGR